MLRCVAWGLALGGLVLAGCGANPSTTCEIEPEAPLPGPAIAAPAAGTVDVDAATLRIEVEPPPADREHVRSEIEIWRYANGERLLRVWLASIDDPARLADLGIDAGAFEGVADVSGLLGSESYAVRARHLLAGEGCDEWTDWSADNRFLVDDGSSALFDDTVIRDIELEIGQPSYDSINAEAVPPGCVPFTREYYEVNAIIDGTRYDGAGGRVKGGCGSARDLSGKAAFKIHLSWDNPAASGCPETRRAFGRKRITLNNMVQDRSFVRERLTYHYYERMGVPVPRVAHSRLSVNGEHWGLYLNIESIDRRMLKRHFASNDGMLFEGTYFCDLIPQNVPPNLEDDFCIQAKFDVDLCDGSPDPGADPLDYSTVRDLAAAIEALPDGAFYPAIADLIDWDSFLSLWAADAVLGHWDGYAYDIINNYRVYHDPIADRWTLIPTGVDQTLDRDVDPFAPSALLATRCLAEPACEALFVARLEEAVTTFETAGLLELSMSIEAQIAAEVMADPRKPGGDNAFANQLTIVRDFIVRRPGEIRAYIDAR